MSHTMKLWEKVIEHILREETTIAENEFVDTVTTATSVQFIRNLTEE